MSLSTTKMQLYFTPDWPLSSAAALSCWFELTHAIARSHEICQTCFRLQPHGNSSNSVTHNTDHITSGLYDLLDRIS